MVWRKLRVGCWIGLLLLMLAPAISPAQAQQPAGTLAELIVDIWPDFDRPEVLVLLTGRLAEDIPLPATVTLPLPVNASLNAVARITSDNLMIDDIEFTPEGDSVTLVTPDARFRVEYYLPYDQNGDERQFTYHWLAGDLSVSQLAATIQQPAAADDMTVTPEAETISVGGDGLTYYNMLPVAVPAGEPYTVEMLYTTDSDLLTESVLQVNDPPPAIVEQPAGDAATTLVNWPLIFAGAAGVLVVLVVGWQVVVNRQARPAALKKRPQQARRKGTPAGTPADVVVDTGRVNFCHQCGARAQQGDKFCRNCGTALKKPAK